MRKSTKAKSKVMIILPASIALLKESEGPIGYLDKIDSPCPEFVIKTIEVECSKIPRSSVQHDMQFYFTGVISLQRAIYFDLDFIFLDWIAT